MAVQTIKTDGFTATLSPRLDRGALVCYRVDLRYPDGRRHRSTLGTTDHAEAHRLFDHWARSVLPSLIADYHRAQAVPGSDDADPLLGDIVDHYLDTFLPNRNSAPRTIQMANQVLYEFLRFCAGRHVGRLSQLNSSIVDQWAAAMRRDGLAPKSIATRLGLLRAAINAAVSRELIARNPIRRWLMPTVPDPEITPLTRDQLAEVLAIIRRDAPEYANVITWVALTGNRPSDACALRWSQVDLITSTVVRAQVKTRRLARYDLSQASVALLRSEHARHPDPPGSDAPVFSDANRRPFTVHRLYRQFTRTLIAANYPRPVNLKDLRHTFGSLLANDPDHPCPLPILQTLMGHRDIKTTMKYVKPAGGHAYVDHHAAQLIQASASPNTTENPRHARHNPQKPQQKGP